PTLCARRAGRRRKLPPLTSSRHLYACLRRATGRSRIVLALFRLTLTALHDRRSDAPFLLDSQEPCLDLGLEALAVALAVEVLGALDLLVADAHRLHRHPRHAHGRIEQLANGAADRRALELEERPPVEYPDEDGRLRECLVHRFDQFGPDLVAV